MRLCCCVCVRDRPPPLTCERLLLAGSVETNPTTTEDSSTPVSSPSANGSSAGGNGSDVPTHNNDVTSADVKQVRVCVSGRETLCVLNRFNRNQFKRHYVFENLRKNLLTSRRRRRRCVWLHWPKCDSFCRCQQRITNGRVLARAMKTVHRQRHIKCF